MTAINNNLNLEINSLPDDILANKIFPLLLDPEKPDAIGSLNPVCKRWRNIMQQERPYSTLRSFPNFEQNYPEMAAQKSLGKSDKSSYVDSFPHTTMGKMISAYQKMDKQTSTFESRTLIPILLSCPYLLPITNGLHVLLSLAPDLRRSVQAIRNIWNGQPIQIQPNPLVGWVASAFMLSTFPAAALLRACTEGLLNMDRPICYVHSRLLAILCLWGVSASATQILTNDSDSMLSQGYRVAKCSLAALGALGKDAYRKMRNCLSYYQQRQKAGNLLAAASSNRSSSSPLPFAIGSK